MSTLLYFLPRTITNHVQNAQELIDAGLSHVDPRMGGASNFTASGPGGSSGALWTMKLPDGNDGPEPLFRPESQTWRKSPDGKYHVGFVNDARPTPDTLARTKMLDGTPVKLLDGNEWIIPLCVPCLLGEAKERSASSLPQEFDLNDAGRTVQRVRRDYSSLHDRCYGFFQRYTAMVEDAGDVEADIQLAVDLLSVNYRIGRVEAVALLKLLGSEEYYHIIRAAIEADAIDAAIAELVKKGQASDDSATNSGATAVAPISAAASAGAASATSN